MIKYVCHFLNRHNLFGRDVFCLNNSAIRALTHFSHEYVVIADGIFQPHQLLRLNIAERPNLIILLQSHLLLVVIDELHGLTSVLVLRTLTLHILTFFCSYLLP